MAKLTAKELSAFTTDDNGTILRENGGLVGKVRAGVRGVTMLFRFEFKHEGVKRDLSLGSWPKKSLAQIRVERDEVKAMTAKGILPTVARKAAKIEAQAAVAATIAESERLIAENKTVSDLFEEWVRDGVSREDANAELRRSFSKDVLPIIGSKPLRSLTEKDLLSVLRSVKSRGLNRTVVIRSNDIGQMLRWAEKRKPWRSLMADGNPADLVDVKNLLDNDYQEQRSRLLSPKELRELRDTFAWPEYGNSRRWHGSWQRTGLSPQHCIVFGSSINKSEYFMYSLLLGNGVNWAALQKNWTQLLRELAAQFETDELIHHLGSKPLSMFIEELCARSTGVFRHAEHAVKVAFAKLLEQITPLRRINGSVTHSTSSSPPIMTLRSRKPSQDRSTTRPSFIQSPVTAYSAAIRRPLRIFGIFMVTRLDQVRWYWGMTNTQAACRKSAIT